jgi:hypothetical protein
MVVGLLVETPSAERMSLRHYVFLGVMALALLHGVALVAWSRQLKARLSDPTHGEG